MIVRFFAFDAADTARQYFARHWAAAALLAKRQLLSSLEILRFLLGNEKRTMDGAEVLSLADLVGTAASTFFGHETWLHLYL